jgi:hypothetical protein
MALRLHHLWLNDTYHTVFYRMRNGIASWAKAIAIMESNVCALRRLIIPCFSMHAGEAHGLMEAWLVQSTAITGAGS